MYNNILKNFQHVLSVCLSPSHFLLFLSDYLSEMFFFLVVLFFFTCGIQVLKQRLKRHQVSPHPPPPPSPRKTFGSFLSSLFYLGNGQKLASVFSFNFIFWTHFCIIFCIKTFWKSPRIHSTGLETGCKPVLLSLIQHMYNFITSLSLFLSLSKSHLNFSLECGVAISLPKLANCNQELYIMFFLYSLWYHPSRDGSVVVHCLRILAH